jgi:ribose 5-phosphate isomerase B
METIYIASDHGGFALKKTLVKHLQSTGFEVKDMGANSMDPDDDYPDFALPAARKIVECKNSLGVLICRNGIGISIIANKVRGVRAGLCTFVNQAISARTDDNCNILVLPADYIDVDKAKKIIDAFLKTKFSDVKRHVRRLNKIAQYERTEQ